MIASVSKAADRRPTRKPLPPSRLTPDMLLAPDRIPVPASIRQKNEGSMETLSAEGIGKSYKGRQVVRGINLRISRGEVVGLLGPNGAGKTTSFYMIVGLVPPDTGREQ